MATSAPLRQPGLAGAGRALRRPDQVLAFLNERVRRKPSGSCSKPSVCQQLRVPSSSRRRHGRTVIASRQDAPNSTGKGFGEAPASSPSLWENEEKRRAPRLVVPDGDRAFEERLKALKISGEARKQVEVSGRYAPIDYDNPQKWPEDPSGSGSWTQDLGPKIGIGVAATVFAAIFAFGDIFPAPTGPPPPSSQGPSTVTMLTLEEVESLKASAEDFESTLRNSPDDMAALEGAAVTYVELGDLPRAEERLQRLQELSPDDVEAVRMLAQVQFARGSYAASASSYRLALQVSRRLGSAPPIDIVQGLTGALIADGRAKDAVGFLVDTRQTLAAASAREDAAGAPVLDPVQVDLLLGKAYSAWGRPGDAAAVYDSLVAAHPDDFRGYLAKGLLLRSQGSEGDAQRMFLQARYLSPEVSKGLVETLITKN